jgi:subfamily B ATP-binding cassette protein MsbA
MFEHVLSAMIFLPVVVGLALMLVSRMSQLVLPFAPKWIVDDVLGKGRSDLLVPIALATAGATGVQGVVPGDGQG